MESAVGLVKFRDGFEEDAEVHFGILFDNDWVLCLCCGSWLEPKDYELVERFHGFEYLDETLQMYYE